MSAIVRTPLPTTVHVDNGVGYVLPNVPAEAPPEVAEGLYRRRLVATTGRCPCGAEFRPTREQRRKSRRTGAPVIIAVRHEQGCPADTATLDAAVRAWRAGVSR